MSALLLLLFRGNNEFIYISRSKFTRVQIETFLKRDELTSARFRIQIRLVM